MISVVVPFAAAKELSTDSVTTTTQYFDQDGISIVTMVINQLSSPVTLSTVLVLFVVLAGIGAYLSFGIIIVLLFMRR